MTMLYQLLKRALWRWEETLAVAALVVVIASVSFGVVTRYVSATSATWAVELAGLAFTWCVFLGAAAAFRKGMHVSVELFVAIIPVPMRVIVSWMIDIIVLGFLGYLLYLSALITLDSGSRPSPVLRIPFTYVYGALVLSVGSMLVHHILQMLARHAGRERPST